MGVMMPVRAGVPSKLTCCLPAESSMSRPFKLLFHLQECILRSQTVLDMHSTYICVPKNWIRSVERMAALTTIDAFSAVKSCKNTRLNIKSPQIMVGLSKMIKFYDNLDITYIEELSIKLQEHMCIFL
ncbi:PREDICTED: uncharacterized protein LOC102007544 isoform X2 [Chinchilla lanigera]|uniref:uncharacterized protein LOC102007544 isoform X2 n=1 Tax=Chinchilla lanigera TaxID=34839 RepID=UPI000696B7E2|nr:PREDICTED: uncharacterized protein LOC102007544 isoform X2 [Chinchilla lanigera]